MERPARAAGSRRDLALAAAPGLVALATTLALIGNKSMWGDEAFSVELARLPFASFWEVVSERQANGSLHALALRLWVEAGDSESWVRALSALSAVAGVVVVSLLGIRLFGRVVGLTAGLLLGANAFLVHYAQETRGYTLALLLVAVATLLFVRAVESGSSIDLLAYVLVGSASLYAHFFAALVIAAHGVALPFAPGRGRARAIGALGAVALLAAPLAVFVATRDAGQVDLQPGASPARIAAALGALSGGTFATLGLYALGGLLAVVAIWRRRAELSAQVRWRYALVLAWLVVPLAGSVLVNVVKPFFQARYLLVSLPALALVVAVGLASIRSRIAFASACALLALASAHALAGWYEGEEKEGLDFRAAAERIAAEGRPADGIVFYRPSRRLPVEYYLRRDGALGRAPEPVFPTSAWGAFDLVEDYEARRPARGWEALLEGAASSHRRVWLVRSTTELAPDELAALEAELEERYDAGRASSHGRLEVVLYELAPN